MNIAVRDRDKLEKLRVTKVVHAFLHKKLFIFYQKPQQFQDITQMLIANFRFEKGKTVE